MNKPTSSSEFLVISRGKWDSNISPQQIQTAIDEFYRWLEGLVTEGKMRRGQRLGIGGKTVTKNAVTDGPFGEAKEVIGGYWTIVASDLEEAAYIARQNPCLQYGLFYEIRPIDPVAATAFTVTNETPAPEE